MFVLLGRRLLRRLQVVLGLALMGLVFAPSASAAGQLDTATATGSGSNYFNVNINAQSGTSGQNPSGTVSFNAFHAFNLSGSVTCLSVTGSDRGGGTSGSPTTAVLNLLNTASDFPNTVFTVELVDNGGNGADIMSTVPTGRGPTDCSLPFSGETDTLTNGRAVVFDAPPLPTSKEQCKNGGWRNFPQFKNQGDCVSFVATGGKNRPG